MSTTIGGVRIVDMPDLGAVTDDSSVVGEHAGSGRFSAPAFRTYMAVTVAAAAAPAFNNTGRNLLHNSMFNVLQRGNGAFAANGYTADRWYHLATSDAFSVGIAAVSNAQRAQIGDEQAGFLYNNTFTGNAAATAFNMVLQRIEGVRRLGGRTVTVSFWAACGAGALKLGASIDQSFGTGGSPSGAFQGAGTAVTLSTTLARYSISLNVPSTSGKTLGTNHDDYTELDLWFSSGANNATRSGSVGVQSGTINLWGVQLEIGSVATALEKPDPRLELANCQRFYWTSGGIMNVCTYGNAAGVFPSTSITFPTMRATPTAIASSPTFGNATAASLNSGTPSTFNAGVTQVAAGFAFASFTLLLSADL